MSILRYSEEQNEFKSIIKIIFEDKFKEYVNNYINNIGYDYLIQIINEDYEMNIADSFRFFNTNIKDIYNFMNVLIDTSELKALGYELIVGIINNFLNISAVDTSVKQFLNFFRIRFRNDN